MNDWQTIRHIAYVEACSLCGKQFDNRNNFVMHRSYEKRKEAVKQRAKQWATNNPEKRRLIVKQNNERSRLRKKQWLENKDFSGNKHISATDKCVMCGLNEKLVIHHVDGNNGFAGKPVNNDAKNLVILCKHCHPKVHNRWWLKIGDRYESMGAN